jgi:hypothetical protein
MREDGCCGVIAFDFHLEHAAVGAVLHLDFHRQTWTGTREHERFLRTVDANAAVQYQTAMVWDFAREHRCALAASNIKRIRRAGKRPVAYAKSRSIDCKLDIFAFYEERPGTELAGTVTRWSPERSSTVKPPPSQPALAAANDRSTAVIVRSATAAAPKQNRPPANRARAIVDFFVMRDDLKPRARFDPPKTGQCDSSIIDHGASLP